MHYKEHLPNIKRHELCILKEYLVKGVIVDKKGDF